MRFSARRILKLMSLDIDLSPFFDQLNVYLPVFLGLFAIVGAIGGAIALSGKNIS
jgi:hypothetical protein